MLDELYHHTEAHKHGGKYYRVESRPRYRLAWWAKGWAFDGTFYFTSWAFWGAIFLWSTLSDRQEGQVLGNDLTVWAVLGIISAILHFVVWKIVRISTQIK